MSMTRVGPKNFPLYAFAALVIVSIMGTASIAIADSGDATSTPDTTISNNTNPSTGDLLTSSTTETQSVTATTTDESFELDAWVATSSPSAASSTAPALTCTAAYTADLFDTQSGHTAPGATRIGIQSWTICHDEQGKEYEFKMPPEEYAALARPWARMPVKYASSSTELDLLPPSAATIGTSPETPMSTTTENVDVLASATSTATTSTPDLDTVNIPETEATSTNATDY